MNKTKVKVGKRKRLNTKRVLANTKDITPEFSAGAIVSGASTGVSMGLATGNPLVGLGAGLATTGLALYQEDQTNKLEAKRKATADYNTKKLAGYQDEVNASVYSEEANNASDGYYKAGGLAQMPVEGMPVSGGKAIPLSDNAVLLKGKTHGEGGIETPVGEMENNEVVRKNPDGTIGIDSAKNGTSAITAPMEAEKGKLQGQLDMLQAKQEKLELGKSKAQDVFTSNKMERELEKIEAQSQPLADRVAQLEGEIQKVFEQQQAQNIANGLGQDGQGQGQPMTANPNEEPQFAAGARIDGTPSFQMRSRYNETTKPLSMMDKFKLKRADNREAREDRQDDRIYNKALRQANRRATAGERDANAVTGLPSDKFANLAPLAGSLIDNVGNAFLTNQYADIDPAEKNFLKPGYTPSKYDIRPELKNIKDTSQAARQFTADNTADSNTMLARTQGIDSRAIPMVNKLYADKVNKETMMRDSKLAKIDEMGMINARKGDAYNIEGVANAKSRLGQTSANVSDFGADVVNYDQMNRSLKRDRTAQAYMAEERTVQSARDNLKVLEDTGGSKEQIQLELNRLNNSNYDKDKLYARQLAKKYGLTLS